MTSRPAISGRLYPIVACMLALAMMLLLPISCSRGPKYDLTIAGNAGGTVETPGEGTFTYAAGTEVALLATPDPGYGFVCWTGDVETVADVDSASTVIVMNGGYSITAEFQKVYNLTITSRTGGTVTASYGATEMKVGAGQTKTMSGIPSGTTVAVAAGAADWYRFTKWTGLIDGTDDPESAVTFVTLNMNYTIVAGFQEIDSRILEVGRPIDGGQVIEPGAEGRFRYLVGEVVDLVAQPGEGWEFHKWHVQHEETVADIYSASTTIVMDRNNWVTAGFVPK